MPYLTVCTSKLGKLIHARVLLQVGGESWLTELIMGVKHYKIQ